MIIHIKYQARDPALSTPGQNRNTLSGIDVMMKLIELVNYNTFSLFLILCNYRISQNFRIVGQKLRATALRVYPCVILHVLYHPTINNKGFGLNIQEKD